MFNLFILISFPDVYSPHPSPGSASGRFKLAKVLTNEFTMVGYLPLTQLGNLRNAEAEGITICRPLCFPLAGHFKDSAIALSASIKGNSVWEASKLRRLLPDQIADRSSPLVIK